MSDKPNKAASVIALLIALPVGIVCLLIFLALMAMFLGCESIVAAVPIAGLTPATIRRLEACGVRKKASDTPIVVALRPRGVIRRGDPVTLDLKGRARRLDGRPYIMAGPYTSTGYTHRLKPIGVALEHSKKHKRVNILTTESAVRGARIVQGGPRVP